MGSRAHYVIIDNGGHRVLYSQWGGDDIDLDLLPGPDGAVRFARSQHPVESWVHDEMCDGAAVIDLDARTLLWFGSCDRDPAVRSAALAALRRTWAGWTVEWAYNGLRDVVARVGVDPDTVRLPRAMRVADDLRTPEDFHRAFPQMRLHPDTYPPGSLLPREIPIGPLRPSEADLSEGWSFTLVTVHSEGRVRAYATNAPPSLLLENGEEGVFDHLSSWTPITRTPRCPAAGVHLDADRKRGGVWTSSTLGGEPFVSADLWPAWRWDLWEDRVDEHLMRCGEAVAVPVPDIGAGFERLSERFKGHQDGGSAIDGISALLAAIGTLRSAAERSGAEVRADTGNAMLHRPVDLEDGERRTAEAAIEDARSR